MLCNVAILGGWPGSSSSCVCSQRPSCFCNRVARRRSVATRSSAVGAATIACTGLATCSAVLTASPIVHSAWSSAKPSTSPASRGAGRTASPARKLPVVGTATSECAWPPARRTRGCAHFTSSGLYQKGARRVVIETISRRSGAVVRRRHTGAVHGVGRTCWPIAERCPTSCGGDPHRRCGCRGHGPARRGCARTATRRVRGLRGRRTTAYCHVHGSRSSCPAFARRTTAGRADGCRFKRSFSAGSGVRVDSR